MLPRTRVAGENSVWLSVWDASLPIAQAWLSCRQHAIMHVTCMRIVCAFCCDGGGCLSSLTAPRGRAPHSLEDFYVVGVGVCFHSKTPKAQPVWTHTSCVTSHVGILHFAQTRKPLYSYDRARIVPDLASTSTASLCGPTSTTAWPRRTVSAVTNCSDPHLRTWS
jgi:hypothetical protein